MKLGDEIFQCDKCRETKSTDGALMHRDPRIDYCICRLCRDQLVDLLQKAEWETTILFLQPERLNEWARKGCESLASMET